MMITGVTVANNATGRRALARVLWCLVVPLLTDRCVTGRMANGEVGRIQAFLNHNLRNDLRLVCEARDGVCEEIEEYSRLKWTIEKLGDSGIGEDLKTQMDVGCNFYMEAVVKDPSRIMVCIGYGFFAELSQAEALSFISKKVALLEEKGKVLSIRASYIKARITLILQGLRELENMSPCDEIGKVVN